MKHRLFTFLLFTQGILFGTITHAQQLPYPLVNDINRNKIVFGDKTITNTEAVTDPVSGKSYSKVSTMRVPASVNGKPVYDVNELDKWEAGKNYIPLEEKILAKLQKKIQPILDSIPLDGTIKLSIPQVVIDEKGNIVYASNLGSSILYMLKNGDVRRILSPVTYSFFSDIKDVPLTCKGKDVCYVKAVHLDKYMVEVKDGAMRYRKL